MNACRGGILAYFQFERWLRGLQSSWRCGSFSSLDDYTRCACDLVHKLRLFGVGKFKEFICEALEFGADADLVCAVFQISMTDKRLSMRDFLMDSNLKGRHRVFGLWASWM